MFSNSRHSFCASRLRPGLDNIQRLSDKGALHVLGCLERLLQLLSHLGELLTHLQHQLEQSARSLAHWCHLPRVEQFYKWPRVQSLKLPHTGVAGFRVYGFLGLLNPKPLTLTAPQVAEHNTAVSMSSRSAVTEELACKPHLAPRLFVGRQLLPAVVHRARPELGMRARVRRACSPQRLAEVGEGLHTDSA